MDKRNHKIKDGNKKTNYTSNISKMEGLKMTLFLESLIAELNDLISYRKELLQAKTYWSILKSFYNDRKVPLILPLLIDDKFVTDIQTKANIFNKFFADQCQPLNNASDLPTNQIFLTQSRLGSLDFNEGELLQIIRALT